MLQTCSNVKFNLIFLLSFLLKDHCVKQPWRVSFVTCCLAVQAFTYVCCQASYNDTSWIKIYFGTLWDSLLVYLIWLSVIGCFVWSKFSSYSWLVPGVNGYWVIDTTRQQVLGNRSAYTGLALAPPQCKIWIEPGFSFGMTLISLISVCILVFFSLCF